MQSKIFFQKCEVEILIKQMANLQLASETHRCRVRITS